MRDNTTHFVRPVRPLAALKRRSTLPSFAALVAAVGFVLVAAPPARAQTPTTAPPKPPPFPNRANELMPDWLRLRGEFRERVEGFDNSGYTEGRDDGYFLTRFRLNATVTPSRVLSFQVQAQDARVADKNVGPTGSPFSGPFDLRMAFGDVGTSTSRAWLRVGRQELVYGEQRLVGHVSWLNTARTFDGARAVIRSKGGKGPSVDLFATSVVRILDGEFDKSGAGNRFAGAYGTLPSLVPQGTVEPYYFYRSDRNIRSEAGTLARLHSSTVGVRWVGKLPARLDYNTDLAVQAGSLASDSISAWAGHWQIRETFPGVTALRLSSEYNFASGDSNPTDGTRGTFDTLYPTPHDKYGLADQVGWKNIRHVRAGGELVPWNKVLVGANYHSWWLDETRDGLYAAGGGLVARVPGGAASAHVGQELDIQASRALTQQLQVGGGYAHIFPGAFLHEATPGASYSYPYVMVTYVFLADR